MIWDYLIFMKSYVNCAWMLVTSQSSRDDGFQGISIKNQVWLKFGLVEPLHITGVAHLSNFHLQFYSLGRSPLQKHSYTPEKLTSECSVFLKSKSHNNCIKRYKTCVNWDQIIFKCDTIFDFGVNFDIFRCLYFLWYFGLERLSQKRHL